MVSLFTMRRFVGPAGKLITPVRGPETSSMMVCTRCPSVVMSLWPVDDRSVSELMKDFYAGLASGRNKGQALRRAKLQYLNHADAKTADPYYWAGVITIGNPDALPLPVKKSGLRGFLIPAGFAAASFFILGKRIFKRRVHGRPHSLSKF